MTVQLVFCVVTSWVNFRWIFQWEKWKMSGKEQMFSVTWSTNSALMTSFKNLELFDIYIFSASWKKYIVKVLAKINATFMIF